MKALWIVLIIGFTVGEARAQKMNEENVPDGIRESLQQYFQITHASWNKESENYEATFIKKQSKVSVVFSATGSILEIEKEADRGELPVAIYHTLKDDYPKFNIKEMTRIDSMRVISYEVAIEKGNETYDLIFDPKGKLIHKLVKENDEED